VSQTQDTAAAASGSNVEFVEGFLDFGSGPTPATKLKPARRKRATVGPSREASAYQDALTQAAFGVPHGNKNVPIAWGYSR
jgi:hypothetical protein